MKRNRSIYAAQIENQNAVAETLKPQDFIDSQTIEKKKTRDRYKTVQEFNSRAEQLAKSSVFYKNHYYTFNLFPEREALRRVSKFFPYAEGGPLYVDEPTDKSQETNCRIKADAMKTLGLTYVVITNDDELFDLQESIRHQRKPTKQ